MVPAHNRFDIGQLHHRYYGSMTGERHTTSYAELHLHLEGSVQPSTLRELDPSLSVEEISSRMSFTDFAGFIQAYIWVNRLLNRPEDYALITRRLLDDLSSQGVVYAEITISAGVVIWRGQDLSETFAAIREASRGHSVKTAWIPDAVRHFGPEAGMKVAEFAASQRANGVVAFGIGGDEQRGPAEWFRGVFRFVREAGLRLTAHAGETVGPASIWAALEIGAERIGHGIRAIEDPLLVRHLADLQIPLEVCITSNVCTGVTPNIASHPVRRLYDAGIPITLSTDDPALFRTTLVNEYHAASHVLGFSQAELEAVRRNAFKFAFDPAITEALA